MAPESPQPARVPATDKLDELRPAVQGCRACALWEGTTQAVFGEGRAQARLMLVGEQPGDREDREGHPFVGPAGRVLDNGLERAGIDRTEVYVTNVVKHFRYKARGKRRIHQTPERAHIAACAPWLEAELRIVAPAALVCLGATAARALLGSGARVGRDRGQPLDSDLAPLVTLTTHPSAILRVPDAGDREAAMAAFVSDLGQVARWLAA
ncbi:MAG: uracil-DNA glycosylase [Solirubrobacteraceae bacterium]|jgi:DNA polymerase|nr:uracil-DNA glycosylase [Solirubrobacteraceae bacterium]